MVLDALGLEPAPTAPVADDDIELALDVVRKWLEGKHDGDRQAAVRELVRFCMLRG